MPAAVVGAGWDLEVQMLARKAKLNYGEVLHSWGKAGAEGQP